MSVEKVVSRDRELFLNSEDSVRTDNGGYRFDTSDIFMSSTRYNVRVLSVAIPKSWYNVTESSNSIQIGLSNYTLSPGYYDIFSMTNALNSLSSLMAISFSEVTGKLTFVSKSASFIYLLTKIKIIGLVTDQLYTFETMESSLVSDVCNTSTTKFVHLTCEELITDSLSSNRSANGVSLASINGSDILSFSYLTRVYSNEISLQARSSYLTINILDDNGNPIDLNGQSFTILLQVRFNQTIFPEEAEK